MKKGAISFSYEAFRKHVNAWKNHQPEPQKNHRKEEMATQIPNQMNYINGS